MSLKFHVLVLGPLKQRQRDVNAGDGFIESLDFGNLLLHEIQKFLICIELQRLYSNLHFYLLFLPWGGR